MMTWFDVPAWHRHAVVTLLLEERKAVMSRHRLSHTDEYLNTLKLAIEHLENIERKDPTNGRQED